MLPIPFSVAHHGLRWFRFCTRNRLQRHERVERIARLIHHRSRVELRVRHALRISLPCGPLNYQRKVLQKIKRRRG